MHTLSLHEAVACRFVDIKSYQKRMLALTGPLTMRTGAGARTRIYRPKLECQTKVSDRGVVRDGGNPYFWGVDEAGNQLPYFDGVNHRLFETVDVFNLWIVNGEIDFQARHVDAAAYTLYKESEASGDYKVVVGVRASHVAVQLNLATKNDKLREFFNTRDVRFRFILLLTATR
jgi:hypothetical protein